MNVLGRSLTLSGLLFSLVACSGGSGSGGGSMFIETCTLGCGSGEGGNQVSCQFNQTAVNQEIAVFFSSPVDPASITSASFQIINLVSGAAPNGARFLDPSNPRKVLFRPEVSFESDGTISFGFEQDATYRVTVPGTAQGDAGPFIRSTSGTSNSSRLSCDIFTSQAAVDLVPGPPLVQVFVKTAIVATPEMSDFVPDVLVTDVPPILDLWQGSDIRFEFNDLMNPATLANPTTGDSAFVKVEVDGDGNLSTPDRTTLFGSYTVQLDPIQLRTTMIFTPFEGIPSSGSLDPLINDNGLPRKVVITVPSNLQDVAGNSLGNPITAALTPEYIEFDPVTLPDADGESFTDSANQDIPRSGAGRDDTPMWANGRLTRAWGGGRGRLGELIVRAGVTLTLSTDSQTFPLDLTGPHDVLTNEIAGVDYNPLSIATWPTITVTDGAFEFSALTVEAGGTLRFSGVQPARLFVRGNVNILGVVDLGGSTPPNHNSTVSTGEAGAAGGPNGGAGGAGATRFDFNAPNSMLTLPGGALNQAVDLPNGVANVDGISGAGVGRVDMVAAGFGGLHWPTVTPVDRSVGPATAGDFRPSFVPEFDCRSLQSGRPGAGGSYGTDGTAGIPMSSSPLSFDMTPNTPGPTEGGGFPMGNADLMLEPPGAPPVIRRLAFEAGNLRGGSGGGGGGASIYGTLTDSFQTCTLLPPTTTPPFPGTLILSWTDHSAAGGGGGGGALQLVAGGPSIGISGLLHAGGGDGGSGIPAVPADITEDSLRTKRAMPGGGGSGGAIRIQAVNFPTSALGLALPPRLDVAGGVGGMNSHGALGGNGGAGLIRLEGLNSQPNAALTAPVLAPTDVAIVGPDAENILSIGAWNQPRVRPESYSGAMSCWMRPPGTSFRLVFLPDSPMEPDPAERYGWDMTVLYGNPVQSFSYRDPTNSPFPGESFETRFGNLFDQALPGSYIVVRFQGARAAGDIQDLCNVDSATQIVTNSLTPWVTHPSELNQFSPAPNLVRFSVTFDFASLPGSQQAQIQGVTGLKVRMQPD